MVPYAIQRFIILSALVLLCFGAFLSFSPLSAAASQAALFLNPQSGSFLVGSTFDVSIVLDTKGVAVNTIEVELQFPADMLQLVSPSVGKSIIQLWPAPPSFSNRDGIIYFVGGAPSPGIVTSQGVVLTLTFRVASPGEGEIRFGGKTSVLANDGRGTNILGQKPSAFFTFLVPPPQGPSISSPTHPDQERWYRDPNPTFLWSKNRFADGYSYAIDHDPAGFPDTVAEGTVSTASFQNLDSGFWYFHIREQAGSVWGGVSHYVVKIDIDPPALFRANVSPGRRTTNRNPIFRFFTTDALSGFDHFEMKIVPLSGIVQEALFFEVTSPYQAPNFKLGRYQVIVRALDRAGNTRDEAVAMNIVGSLTQFINPEGIDFIIGFVPWSTILSIVTILLFLFLVLLFILWRKHKHHVQHAFREDFKNLLRFLRKGPTLPFLLLVVLVLFGVVGFSIVEAAFKIAAPMINIAPQTYLPLDEMLYIEGKAPPGVMVEVLFEKVAGGAQPVRLSAEANSNGEWYVQDKLELSSGEWSARARSVMDSQNSDWSNPRIIRTVVSGIAFGSIKIRYLPILLMLIVLFSAAGILFVYSVIRVRRIREREITEKAAERERALEKNLREKEREITKVFVEQNFSELRRNILEELDHLEENMRTGKVLSPEEERHRKGLLRKLQEAEEEIERKLKGIT